MIRSFNAAAVVFSGFRPQSRFVCAPRTTARPPPSVCSPCVFEVVDRAGQRVYVDTAASMEAAVVPRSVQQFAGGGCEVRKVCEVEGGRDALLAAKTAVVAESVASGCALLNYVACTPSLYEVVDEAECRVYVGVSRNMYNTNRDLRRHGVLCDGRVVRKVRDVPVGMSDAEAKYALIAESVASGCRLLNRQIQKKKPIQSGCVFEVVDRAGQRVYVGTAASMEAAVVPRSVQQFAGGGCEVRKVCEVEGGRNALLAAKTAVVAESVASGCALLNQRVACAPSLYEVVDEAECRVYVGVSCNMYNTNRNLRRRGVLCDGRVVRKVRDVPVGMSYAEAKSALIAESVASGCRLLNRQIQKKKSIQSGCVFEVVDRAGQRVYVDTAASMEAAVVPTTVQQFAGGGCEVRKVCEVEGGRKALLAAKTAVVAESVASGFALLNQRVACTPFLYEVVDEAECRVYVGVSRNMNNTNRNLRRSGVLCDGRVVRKVRDVPVGMSYAEAKYALIAESVASGCRLLNRQIQKKKSIQSGCVFEVVDRAGQRVYVDTAASMEAAVVPRSVQQFAGGGCEVRKVCEVEGGRDALLAAKTAIVAESVASGCALLNQRVACAPSLYEVVDEAECRVYVGVSRNMYKTNHELRRRGVLCDSRVVRKVRDVPAGMSDAEAKYALIAESVASGCRLLNRQIQKKKSIQSGCVFEVVDRAGQRVYVDTAASMEAAVVPTTVQQFAGGGCEVRKVCEVEGGRKALLAAKTAVVAESVASGFALLNQRVACTPSLYEVVDEAECRVYVGVSRNMNNTNRDLRRRGVLCDGRVVRKVRDVPVGMSYAEAKYALIAESVASGCRLLNRQIQKKKSIQSGCVFEVVDRAGQRVYVDTAASMEAAVVPRSVQQFAGGGCEVRKVCEVEGGRNALLAAKTAVVAESVASGFALLNQRVACTPSLYEVVDEAECRVYVGVSRNMYKTNHELRHRGVLCDSRVVRKVRDVPVGMSDAEAKYALIAESVASGCRLLNRQIQKKKSIQSGCVFEVVDRAGQRVYVDTAASMEAAVVPTTVQQFAGGGCEVRKVCEVEGGRNALLAAKTAVVAESVASGCALLNYVACTPSLYEVVDEAECRVYVGVSRNMYITNRDLRHRGVLCDGRVVRKVRDVPVGMSDAEAKYALIAESVASGCRLLNRQIQKKKSIQSGCVFEVVDRAGQRVYVDTAASMEAAVVPRSVQQFAGGGCEVRKVCEVEGGRDALLAAKTAVVAESVASGCALLNQRVACAPFLYEVVDEAECRVYVGVSCSMYNTNRNLRHRGVLCDGWVVRKVRDVPVGMSDAEAKSALIAESVASGFLLQNAAVAHRVAGESDVYPSASFMSLSNEFQEFQQPTDAFHSKHAATLKRHRVGPCPTPRDEGVVYALYDDALSVVYVGQTQYSAVRRAREHISQAVRAHPKRKTRLHAAMIRNGKPFSVVALEKIDVGLSSRRTFRETAVERERHYISVLKPTLNTVFRRLACTRRPRE